MNLSLQRFKLDGSKAEEAKDEGIDLACLRVFSGCT